MVGGRRRSEVGRRVWSDRRKRVVGGSRVCRAWFGTWKSSEVIGGAPGVVSGERTDSRAGDPQAPSRGRTRNAPCVPYTRRRGQRQRETTCPRAAALCPPRRQPRWQQRRGIRFATGRPATCDHMQRKVNAESGKRPRTHRTRKALFSFSGFSGPGRRFSGFQEGVFQFSA